MKAFQLSWTAPSNDGGATIIDYIVQYSSDGQTWTTYEDGVSNATSTTVVGLTECSSYQFRVAAINSVGTGPYSSTASSYLALPPEAITSINATYNGQADVELTWLAPSDNGCSITDYIIQYSNDGGSSWTTVNDGVGTGTTYNIQNLSVGTYVFRVAAINVGGTGTYGQYDSSIDVTTTTTTTTTIAPEGDGYLVSGAGSPVNDTYCLFDTYNGKPRYKASIQYSGYDLFIQWSMMYSGYWIIGNDDIGIALYANSYELEAQITAGWFPATGDPDAPTLSTTTCGETTTTTTTTTTAAPVGVTGYAVSNAVISEVNGTYCEVGTLNNRPLYQKENIYIFFDGYVWYIGDDLTTANYYYAHFGSDQTPPPKREFEGWYDSFAEETNVQVTQTTCGATTTAPESLTLTLNPVVGIDGVRTLGYGTLPVNTTQLKLTLNSISYGAPTLSNPVSFTFDSTQSYYTTYSEDGNLNIYIFGHSPPSANSFVYAGHKNFATNGTVTLEALDSSNNVIGYGTYTGNLSTSDDD